eukprot:TRINITY_DN77_c0_g1_i2.p1 TRINITY_DN77_c0_g1~~TRINITY_DN77_c0_g1_i2.p1  ORF type:complete len:1035 (-),score=141.81 TRINITY_DN77_c0_g1_i2:214-3318(-)
MNSSRNKPGAEKRKVRDEGIKQSKKGRISMATSSADQGKKHIGSHFRETLKKDSFFLSKVFDIVDGKHPFVLSKLAQRMSDTRPMMLKLSTRQAREMTNIQSITMLREALQVAVALEMTVMFEYLFACFSVINSSDEVNTEDKGKQMAPYFSELRREYKNQLMFISHQEMQHMCMTLDMLISIGGKPDLQQVNFPSEIGVTHAKADLMRLNLESLIMFAKNEEPYPDESDSTVTQTALLPTAESGYEYYSIEQMYNAIHEGFVFVNNNIGESMFSLMPGMCNMKKKYKNLDEVKTDINTIQVQGEGAKGGLLFDTIIQKVRDWIKTLVLPTGSEEEKLRQRILSLCDSILSETGDFDKLFPETIELIELVEQLQRISGIPIPIEISSFTSLKSLLPSHWGRFLMMIVNYLMLMGDKDSMENEKQIDANFSRPSYPRPDKLGYHPITQVIVNLTNSSYHLLLKILEGTILDVPPEMDSKYQITERYNNIRFYPIMSILIYPLGEILSYFQLNTTGTDKTAGFPFVPTSDERQINEPLDKFFDVILLLRNIYDQSLKLNEDFFRSLKGCVGTWVKDSDQQDIIIQRVSYLLHNVIRSIYVLYQGFSNGIPPPQDNVTTSCLHPKVKPTEQAIRKSKPPPDHKGIDMFYLNLEFDGYAIYSMATDNDPTYDTRGFCGSQFMFEYNNDPDFTDEFHTQNTLKQGDKTFTRDFIPKKYYKGVKVRSATLVPPCYLTERELIEMRIPEIQAAITKDFVRNSTDFRFDTYTLNNKTYYPKFSQLNYALTREIGIDPINIGFDTKCFSVSRANLLYDKDDQVIDYDTACLTCSQNFGKYPNFADDRMPKSGGYLAWAHPYQANNGLLHYPNQVAKSGSGQSVSDTLWNLQRRSNSIMEEIIPIISKYPDDPLASIIPKFMKNYPESKLICIALMANIPNAADKNRLSYLCTRYLNIIQLTTWKGTAAAFGCFYHVPLNAPPGEDLKAINKSAGSGDVLSSIEFFTKQDWYTDFWVGGVDYDALTFFMTGSMMIPLFLNTPKP